MLGAEMDVHLGETSEREDGNHRNGTTDRKTVDTGSERIVLDIPRDRQGRFDPVLIGKYQRRFPGFDEKIIAMYARGLSTRDIQAHIEELYGIEVSPALVSAVTDAVLEEVTAWQNRPLEPVYAVVYFDALRVKIRDEGLVRNRGGVPGHGDHLRRRQGRAGAVDRAERGGQVLASDHERAQGPRRLGRADRGGGRVEGISRRDHHRVPRVRGTNLRGSLDPSLAAVCLVEGQEAAGEGPQGHLRGGPRPRPAAAELDRFEAGPWGQQHAAVVRSWRSRWEEVIPFFAFSPQVRKILYTTECY